MTQNPTVMGFADLGVAPKMCRLLAAHDITIPSPIQAESIPVALEGGDLIGIAQTGTGKTLAFAIPMAMRLEPGQMGLILAPTRELAQQISETYDKLGLRHALVVGGASMRNQIRALRNKPQVIVATPGRLMDLMNQGEASLKRIAISVLDEADRMLDMGFAPAIRKILSAVPRDGQTLMFSATLPTEIENLSRDFLNNPAKIEIAPQGTASELVEQSLVWMDMEHKHDMLADLLYEEKGSVLVFARTRFGAKKLAKSLSQLGHTAGEIHSDRSLAQRREALARFKSGQNRILVATDIAARGIDVKEISLVVNFDIPDCTEDYIHRIGRTGRAGAEGRAITFALRDQAKDVWDIEKLLGRELEVSELSPVEAPIRRGFQKHRAPASGGSKARPARNRNARPARDPKPQPRQDSFDHRDERRHDAEPRYDQFMNVPPRTERSRSDRNDAPKSDRPQADRSRNDRPRGDWNARPTSDRQRSDRPTFDRNRNDRPSFDRPSLDRPQSDRGRNDRSQFDRPQYDRPNGSRPQTGGSRNDRPSSDRPATVGRPDSKSREKKATPSAFERFQNRKRNAASPSRNNKPKGKPGKRR